MQLPEDANSHAFTVPDEIEEEVDRDIYLKALKILEGYTSDQPMGTKDVIQKIRKEISQSLRDGQVYNILLNASKNLESPIQSRKGRSGGYFLDASEVLNNTGDSPGLTNSFSDGEPLERFSAEPEKTYERHIWPLVSHWLKSQKDLKQATHEYANVKSGGKWGNPDVLALRPIDRLGFFDVEVVTVEVKPSTTNWQYYFFEAVSHKRFAERVYFCFRTGGSDQKTLLNVLDYAEKFRVGVLQIELGEDQYLSLQKWDAMPDVDKLQLVDQVVEVAPAPYDPVNLSDKLDFLERVGIKFKEDIYTFGRQS